MYRVPEPAPGDKMTEPAEAFHATYPGGPHDAEALFVTSANDVFIVTKTRPIGLYRFPKPLRADAVGQLERIATFDEVMGKEKVTGAAASPDARWVVLRTHRSLLVYRTASLVGGHVREAFRFDVSSLKEPQGEAVAVADGTVYLAGEGGGRGGTLATISCTFPS